MSTAGHNCCVINRERKGLRISVRSVLSGLEIKERLDKAGSAGEILYVPGELTKDPEGYSVYIRHKLSLKEYLSETVPDIAFVGLLTEMLCVLWSACEKTGVPFGQVLFDYDAVFLSGFAEQLEFVYLPGALGFNRENNSLTEMLAIIQLHAESGSNEECKALLGKLIDIVAPWEESGAAFPQTELEKLLADMRPENLIRRIVKAAESVRGRVSEAFPRWNRFLWVNAAVFFSAACLLRLIRNLWVWPLWLVMAAATELWAVPAEAKRFCIKWSVWLSGSSLPIQEEITVGRDSAWADLHIDDACVSRRHAVLFQQKRSVRVRDLFSANGTYVDGQKITAGEEVLVHSGQVISFGERSQFSVKFRPRILFAYMVK